MSFLLIPNEATNRKAVIWVCVINEKDFKVENLSVRYSGGNIQLTENWMTFITRSKRNQILYQYLEIPDLQPQTDYFFELHMGNQVFSSCRVRTLPDRLPTVDEKPFTILLGSCFCRGQKGSAKLAAAYRKLRNKENIVLKILCGDQVYLDDPASSFSTHNYSFEDLEEILLNNYVQTWRQGGSLANAEADEESVGYQQFLQDGANFFSSDDHEFWNNAPNRAPLVRNSWFAGGREGWWTIASNLLDIFQRKPSAPFNVGTLSFFIADTRVGRDADRRRFMSDIDFAKLKNWVEGLQDLGVLVVGQPVFSEKAGFFGLSGSFGDWNLSDYEQYNKLASILSKSEHSIIILTGDVHYGRVASCQLRPGVFLYEIISSPTSLVNPLVGGKWHPAPDKFPAFGISGVPLRPRINTLDFNLTKDHFLLLSFYRDGTKTKVVVKACEIPKGGGTPVPTVVTEFNIS
jgi:hypothetical protein